MEFGSRGWKYKYQCHQHVIALQSHKTESKHLGRRNKWRRERDVQPGLGSHQHSVWVEEKEPAKEPEQEWPVRWEKTECNSVVLYKHRSQEKEVFLKAGSGQLCWKVKYCWQANLREDWKVSTWRMLVSLTTGFSGLEGTEQDYDELRRDWGVGKWSWGLFSLDCSFLTTRVIRKEGQKDQFVFQGRKGNRGLIWFLTLGLPPPTSAQQWTKSWFGTKPLCDSEAHCPFPYICIFFLKNIWEG